MKTSLLLVLAAGCTVEAEPLLEENVGVVSQALEIGGDHPCLTEPADVTFSPGYGGMDYYTFATNWDFAQGACTSLIAELTQTNALPARFPALQSFVLFYTGATTEAECSPRASFERAYIKVNNAANWTYVGEVRRAGYWNATKQICEQRHHAVDAPVVIPQSFGTTRKIRIVAAAYHGATGIAMPTIWLDRDPIVVDF